MPTFLYNLGISLLFTHELDATLRSEWRLLYILKDLPDATAGQVFIGLHLPIFLAFLYLGNAKQASVRLFFRRAACLFLIVHAILHANLANHPMSHFEGWLPSSAIYGAAIAGAGYIYYWIRGMDNDS